MRAEKQISHTEIGDITKLGGYILEPYSQTPLEITLRNVTSSPAHATTTKQCWSCTYKGLDKTQTCDCSNTHQEHPAQPAHQGYKPLTFDYFMKRAAGAATSRTGVYTLTETVFLKPRSQAAICSRTTPPCPMPTFWGGRRRDARSLPPPGVPYLRRSAGPGATAPAG